MIEIRGLCKRYRRHWALRDLELTVETGMFGLLGPNGAGKTTLMRILATLLRPTSGEVRIDGISLRQNPDEIRKRIGYLPQFFQIYPQMTAWEFLDYVAVLKGWTDARKRREQVMEVVEQVHLADRVSDKVKTYSGGMRQRLGIAQALLGDPQVLIVDEPTAGLDPEERVRFRNLLATLALHKTVILSTHIVGDIESSCRRVGVLDQGRLVLAGSLGDLQAFAEGKVWEVRVGEERLPELARWQLISTRQEGSEVVCRVIADEPPLSGARTVEPTLEDGYLALLSRRGGDRR
ncbi:ABC transporter ATP-binding protein [Kyrpidia spormannii]|uniref:ABC transporter ATP-binding protein n=1 Tax=Kyrpidia spormannii TaxID=2055160 RepID=A0A2K8N3E7_9BACL|nr:ABC transporter ATP-binding protein [Kyrpidia spormannii]ATY84021.1 ABC transporter ATP-binding protein [Kyrpidia spormannii]